MFHGAVRVVADTDYVQGQPLVLYSSLGTRRWPPSARKPWWACPMRKMTAGPRVLARRAPEQSSQSRHGRRGQGRMRWVDACLTGRTIVSDHSAVTFQGADTAKETGAQSERGQSSARTQQGRAERGTPQFVNAFQSAQAAVVGPSRPAGAAGWPVQTKTANGASMGSEQVTAIEIDDSSEDAGSPRRPLKRKAPTGEAPGSGQMWTERFAPTASVGTPTIDVCGVGRADPQPPYRATSRPPSSVSRPCVVGSRTQRQAFLRASENQACHSARAPRTRSGATG